MIDPIERGYRIQKFLDDEAVQYAIEEMKQANYELFLKAQTPDDRMMAQARAQVTAIFLDTLHAVVSVGEREQLERERAERLSADSHK